MNKPIIHILISSFFIFSFLSCNQKKEQKVETTSMVQTEIKLDLLDLQAKNKLGKDTVVTIVNDPVYQVIASDRIRITRIGRPPLSYVRCSKDADWNVDLSNR